jgi:hypothetical protein
MYTTVDIVNKFYSLLQGTVSNLYKNSKPLDEKMDEYTVVTSLSVSAPLLQECPINVNFHVKDFDGRIANTQRLNTVAKSIIALLDDYNDTDIDIALVFQTLVEEPDLLEHFMNIRFIARHLN